MFFWVLIFLFSISLLSAALAGWLAAPWVPTRKRDLLFLHSQIPIKDTMRVYDLGCGTGSFLFSFAKQAPNATYTGFEISLIPYLIAKIRATRYPNVTIHFQNLYTADYKDADAIFLFLMPKAYKRLAHRLSNLKPSTIIITEAWPILDKKPMKKIKEQGALSYYLYTPDQLK